MRVAVLSLWLVLFPLASPGLGQAPDTTETRPTVPLFETRDLLFAGGFVAGTVAMFPLDGRLAERSQEEGFQEDMRLRGVARGLELLSFPGVVLVGGGAYAAGRIADHPRLADLGLHTMEAIIAAEVVTLSLKSIAGRARPFRDLGSPRDFDLFRGLVNDTFQSFPSGHTTGVFATAAAITTELGEWWPDKKPVIGTILFSGATLAGISRMYHNKHWASDVMAGAAIGSFGGWKIVRFMHTHPGNWIDRMLLPTLAVPDARGGLQLVWVFRH